MTGRPSYLSKLVIPTAAHQFDVTLSPLCWPLFLKEDRQNLLLQPGGLSCIIPTQI